MIDINLLGRFEIYADDQEINIPSRNAQSILAYLILNTGVKQRREKIAGMFWQDMDETNARRNLRGVLTQLRKAIGAQYFGTDKITVY